MDQREDYCEPGVSLSANPWLKKYRQRIVLGAIVLLLVLLTGLVILKTQNGVSRDHYGIAKSIGRADEALMACECYRLRHPKKGYPGTLDELCEEKDGEGPFLSNPERALFDAWGNRLHYALVRNSSGNLEPYVWAERVRDGRITIHGVKLTADGQRVVFGLPKD